MDLERVSVLINSTPIVSFVDYYCGLYEAQPDALSLKITWVKQKGIDKYNWDTMKIW